MTTTNERSHRLRKGLITSVISKCTSILVQFLGLPLAHRVFGHDRYGVYLLLFGLLGLINLINIGGGPGLTLGIVKAAAEDDSKLQAVYYSTSARIVALASGVVSLGLIIYWACQPVYLLFGAEFKPFAPEIQTSFLLLALLVPLATLSNSGFAARAGYQEQFISNKWMTVESVLSVIGILCTVKFFPSIPALLFSVYGIPTLLRFTHFLHLGLIARPFLMKEKLHGPIAKEIIASNLAMTLMTIGAAIGSQGLIILLGRILGPDGIADTTLLLSVGNLVIGFVLLLTAPVWPALNDALLKKDIAWAERAYLKSLALVLGMSLCIGIVMSLYGRTILGVWFGKQANPSNELLFTFALFLAANTIETYHYYVLLGLRSQWQAAIAVLARGILSVALFEVIEKQFGAPSVFISMFSSMAVCTGAYYVYLVQHRLLRAKKEPTAISEGLIEPTG